MKTNRAELSAMSIADIVGAIQYYGSIVDNDHSDVQDIGGRFQILVKELNSRLDRVFIEARRNTAHMTHDGEIEQL